MKLNQLDLFVLCMLSYHKFACAFVSQLQTGFIAAFSHPCRTILEHPEETAREVLEFYAKPILRLHCLKGAAACSEMKVSVRADHAEKDVIL